GGRSGRGDGLPGGRGLRRRQEQRGEVPQDPAAGGAGPQWQRPPHHVPRGDAPPGPRARPQSSPRHPPRVISPASPAYGRGARRLRIADREGRRREATAVAQRLEAVTQELELFRLRLREPVNPRHNVERFAPVTARFVRFTVLATNDGSEPALDELEAWTEDN